MKAQKKKAILLKETIENSYLTFKKQIIFCLYEENENFDLIASREKKWDLIEYAIKNDIEISNLTK